MAVSASAGFRKSGWASGPSGLKLKRAIGRSRDPRHSDYAGTLLMANGERAMVRLWVHADGSLGLRVALAPRP